MPITECRSCMTRLPLELLHLRELHIQNHLLSAIRFYPTQQTIQCKSCNHGTWSLHEAIDGRVTAARHLVHLSVVCLRKLHVARTRRSSCPNATGSACSKVCIGCCGGDLCDKPADLTCGCDRCRRNHVRRWGRCPQHVRCSVCHQTRD